jgi:UDP-glucose 4-epimerase
VNINPNSQEGVLTLTKDINHHQTILVTGAAGFIGSHLAERLVSEGYHVIGVDCFTDYYSREIKERNLQAFLDASNFDFFEFDLLEIDLTELLQGVDYVFHEAAQAGVRASWGADFEIYTRNNVLATQRLLEAAKETKLEKFVYASSSSVYGDAESYPTSEDMTPKPISPYGVTKLAGEHLCMLYWKNFGVPIVALRYFTLHGPRQRPDMAFSKFIRAMLEDEPITIYEDGEQTRDFTFVDDAVEANLLAMESDVVGEVFNIGGGSQITVNKVVAMLENIIGKDAKIKRIAKQKGDVRHTAADIKKARKLLGYEPRFDLRKGLSLQVEWAVNGFL